MAHWMESAVERENRWKRATDIRQVLVALVTSLSFFGCGVAMKYSDQQKEVLRGSGDLQYETWAESCLPLGALAGSMISSIPLYAIGRKPTLHFIGAPALIVGLAVTLAAFLQDTSSAMYVGLCLQGIGTGFIFTSAPVFIYETVTAELRGPLLITTQLMLSAGMLVGNVWKLRTSVWYYVVPLSVELVFLCAFSFVPESPVWLLMKQDGDRAKEALKKLRGKDYDSAKEVAECQKDLEESYSTLPPKTCFCRLCLWQILKPLLIGIGLACLWHLTGLNAFDFYTLWAFRHSEIEFASSRTVQAYVHANILSGTQIGAVLLAVFLVNRIGRRALLCASIGLTTVAVVMMATYLIQLEKGSVGTSKVLPLLSLIIFTIAFWSGTGSLALVVALEVLAPHSRTFFFSIVTSCFFLLQFAMINLFLRMIDAFNPSGTFWFLASVSAIGFLFVFCCVSEKKKKAEDGIRESHSGGEDGKSTENDETKV